MRRLKLILASLAFAVFSQSGCRFMPHALQPEQLWKMNRQPPMDVRFQSPDLVDNAFLQAGADNGPGS